MNADDTAAPPRFSATTVGADRSEREALGENGPRVPGRCGETRAVLSIDEASESGRVGRAAVVSDPVPEVQLS